MYATIFSMAPKNKFQRLKNDIIEYEPFEACKICRRKWHRICALYSKDVYVEQPFVCEGCRKEKSLPKPENKFAAKSNVFCGNFCKNSNFRASSQ